MAEDWYKEEEADITGNQKSFPQGPKILLSDEEVHLWSMPWRNILVVKVPGKRVNLYSEKVGYIRLWVKQGTMKNIDLADDFIS